MLFFVKLKMVWKVFLGCNMDLGFFVPRKSTSMVNPLKIQVLVNQITMEEFKLLRVKRIFDLSRFILICIFQPMVKGTLVLKKWKYKFKMKFWLSENKDKCGILPLCFWCQYFICSENDRFIRQIFYLFWKW